jgi:hypothetical protein
VKPGARTPAPETHSSNALPIGYRLQEFVIERLLGEGGFGIVYIARDTSLGRQVAIKEFMPGSLAVRSGDLVVSVKSEKFRETFEAGLRSFVNEARLLAQFDHPALVKVYRFWEENGTAYMVMPYYRGVTLRQWLKLRPGVIGEDVLLRLAGELCQPLELLHARGVLHRDIAPDNILVLENGKYLLLDFGAARKIIGDRTQALTVYLKAGYAPIEQYPEVRSMRQGPWTDVYALAAVLYTALARRVPLAAVARMMKDDLVPASADGAGRYSARFLAAIDHAMSLLPQDRPATIADFCARLGVAPKPQAPGSGDDRMRVHPKREAVARGPDQGGGPGHDGSKAQGEAGARARTPDGGVRRRRPAAMIGAAFVLVICGLVAVAWGFFAGDPVSVLTMPVPVPATVPEPAPVPALTQGAPTLADPAKLLEEVHAGRDPGLQVSIRADKESLRIGKDVIRLVVRSAARGYYYVVMAGSEGGLMLLAPPAGQPPKLIEPEGDVELPPFGAGGPPGRDRILLLVSRSPLIFFVEPSTQKITLVEPGKVSAASESAGAVGCKGLYQPCNAAIGSDLLEIEEVAP